MEDLKDFPGHAPTMRRSGKLLNDQFVYKFSLGEDATFFMLRAVVGHAFAMVIFGSCVPGIIENNLEALRKESGVENRNFVLL